jgi:hypothetical protein
MKKHYLKLQVIISAFLLLFAAQSCRKESFHEQQNGRMVPVETEAKTGNQYVLFCFMGHDASKCPGCLCIGGVLTHVDCQGAGDACRNSSCVSLTSTGTDLCATTVDTFGFTSLDILNMPSRSFSLETDPGVYSYLNIPAQLVYRDSTTLQFTFTGLSFTNKPLYSNN